MTSSTANTDPGPKVQEHFENRAPEVKATYAAILKAAKRVESLNWRRPSTKRPSRWGSKTTILTQPSTLQTSPGQATS